MYTEKLLKTLIFLITVTLYYGCRERDMVNNNNKEMKLPENKVVLTREQIKQEQILTGRVTIQNMNKILKCKGIVEAYPGSVAMVSPPMGGFVKSIPYIPGDFVSKGTTLAMLEHPDYIKLQQDFLESKNKLRLYQEEFKRQGELTVENASSIKKLQQAQADYRVTEVQYLSLKARLKLIGINADSLSTDGFQTTIQVKAPISGTIFRVSGATGKFCSQDDIIYEIVNNNNLLLRLDVNEKNIALIKKGLSVRFTLVSYPDNIFAAEIKNFAQKTDDESDIYSCYALIKSAHTGMRPGMHAETEILVPYDSVYTLPDIALITSDSKNYVFLSEDSVFTRIPVETGLKNSGYFEFIHFPDSLTDMQFVINGAKYLNTRFNNK